MRHDDVREAVSEAFREEWGRNVAALLELMVEDGNLKLDWEDEVIAGACITRGGEIVHEGAKQAAGAPAA